MDYHSGILNGSPVVIALILGASLLILSAFVKTRKPALPSFIQGPKPESWLLGNQAEFVHTEAGLANRKWRDRYGPVYRFKGCFNIEWLVLNDANAIQHVYAGQTTTYHLEAGLREFLRVVTGKGIIYADGFDHTRQRRLLQPAFSAPFIKSFVPSFCSCASRVAKQWHSLVERTDGTPGSAVINAYHWMELLSMESSGLTTFGVRFNTIEGEKHELMLAYEGIMNKTYSRPSKLAIILQSAMLQLPPLLLAQADHLPVKGIQTLRRAKATSLKYSKMLFAEKRKQLSENPEAADRDLLSVLVKAGESDTKGKLTPMSDLEIYDHLTSIFVAGYETTANTAAFALYEIARDRRVQAKLYSEIVDIIGPSSDGDVSDSLHNSTFEAMPYLAGVVKETLRLHPGIAYGQYQAGNDDVIPLSHPLKSDTGAEVQALPVAKGQRLLTNVDGVNRSKEIWGPDADDFKPERWLQQGKAEPKDQIGGPYVNIATFGGGPKSCLGWRVAVLELQSFVAVLVREFELSIASPDFEMWRDSAYIATTPTQKGHPELGPYVPLRVSRRSATA